MNLLYCRKIIALSMTIFATFLAGAAFSACPPAPVLDASELVFQLKKNADQKYAWGPTDRFDATEEGALVWDSSQKKIAYCDGLNWISPVSGGSMQNLEDFLDVDLTSNSPVDGSRLKFSAGKWIVYTPPIDYCGEAGGTSMTDGSGNDFCRFDAANCPSGWSQFQNWSAASNRNCSTNNCCSPNNCQASGHSFSNQSLDTCTYKMGYNSCSGCLTQTCQADRIAIGCIMN